jgi:hypothetical protein
MVGTRRRRVRPEPTVATPSRPYLIQVFAVSGWRLGTQKYSYVVTRSRPYPARQSREVEAVSGWRLGTATSCHLPPEALCLPILNTPYSILLYATFVLLHRSSAPICTFALPLSCPQALRPSCPRAGSLAASPRLDPCVPNRQPLPPFIFVYFVY